MVYKNNILSTVLDMSRSSQSVSSLIALISWAKLLWPIEQNVTLKFFLFLGQHIIDDASSNDLKSQKDVDFESFHFQKTLWTCLIESSTWYFMAPQQIMYGLIGLIVSFMGSINIHSCFPWGQGAWYYLLPFKTIPF